MGLSISSLLHPFQPSEHAKFPGLDTDAPELFFSLSSRFAVLDELSS